MLKLPLHQVHESLGARFAPFAGYQMPLAYGSTKDEWAAVRTQAGLFDISHMRPFSIPASSIELLEKVLARSVHFAEGSGMYNAILDMDGSIVDDVIVYRDQDQFHLVANAANAEAVAGFFTRYHVPHRCAEGYVLLALQGPESESVLTKAGFPAVKKIPEFHYDFCSFDGGWIARSGYTGEDGFEIFLAHEQDQMSVMEGLIRAGARPAGLAARDILRLELFYPLHGQDIRPEHSLFEVRLGWLADYHPGCHANPALRKSDPRNAEYAGGGVSSPFRSGEGIPRYGYPIEDESGIIGVVTSGGYSFAIEKGIGIAFLIRRTDVLPEAWVDIRGRREPVIWLKQPVVPSRTRRR